MTKSKIIGRFDPEKTDITDLMNQAIQKSKHEPWYLPGTEFVTLYNVQDPDYPGIPFVTVEAHIPDGRRWEIFRAAFAGESTIDRLVQAQDGLPK